jgi:hypothetical protein
MASASKEDEYAGGCHCGGVRWRVSLPAEGALVAWDCNCSICLKSRNTHVIVPSSHFHLDKGDDVLHSYRFGTKVANHLFCSECGVKSFYRPRSNPDGVAVTIYCLDKYTDLAPRISVRKFDGTDWEGSYDATGIASQSKEVVPTTSV